MLGVSRSGYFAWLRRPPSPRKLQDAELVAHIRSLFDASRRTYGSPRMHRQLRNNGIHVGRKRAARLMAQEGLFASRKRRFVKTTDANHNNKVAPNILDRKFEASAPNKVWWGDITYITTQEGFLYLATLIDGFSRRVVGYAIDDCMETSLPLDALAMAARERCPDPGFLHHTDRGSQYTSVAYGKALAALGPIVSMSRKGECWDNAAAESFFGRFKTELIYRLKRQPKAVAVREVVSHLKFYNAERLHSSLDYKSPIAYEAEYVRCSAAA